MNARAIIEAEFGNKATRPGHVFQTQHDRVDHATADEAIASVEKRGSGSVVRFNVSRNLPNLKPDWEYRSSGLWSFNRDGNGKWQAHDIFSGHGRAYADEKPN